MVPCTKLWFLDESEEIKVHKVHKGSKATQLNAKKTQILDMFRYFMMFQHFNSCQSFQSSNDLQSAGALLFPLAQLASTASTPLVLSFRLPSADHKRPKPLRTSNIFEPTKGTFTTTKTYQDNPRPSWLPYQVAFDLLQLSHEFGILCSLQRNLSNGFNGFMKVFGERCDLIHSTEIQHNSTDFNRFQRTSTHLASSGKYLAFSLSKEPLAAANSASFCLTSAPSTATLKAYLVLLPDLTANRFGLLSQVDDRRLLNMLNALDASNVLNSVSWQLGGNSTSISSQPL